MMAGQKSLPGDDGDGDEDGDDGDDDDYDYDDRDGDDGDGDEDGGGGSGGGSDVNARKIMCVGGGEGRGMGTGRLCRGGRVCECGRGERGREGRTVDGRPRIRSLPLLARSCTHQCRQPIRHMHMSVKSGPTDGFREQLTVHDGLRTNPPSEIISLVTWIKT